MGEDGRSERLALGETVNIAARLEALAAPDTVVISQVTRRLVHDAFALEALGPKTLKGVADPVPVYRVLGLAEACGGDLATILRPSRVAYPSWARSSNWLLPAS